MNSLIDSGGIAVVVVTYQSGSTIDDCLRRLRDAEGVSEIRVTDNGSSDDTLDVVQRHALADARVRFIANPDNPGFAVACNQGAHASNAPWLAFVNPDLHVDTGTLRELRDAARAAGERVLLGADLVDEAGERDSAARRRDPDFAAMLRHPGAGSQLGVAIDDGQLLQEVDAVSGALMLLPRALFDAIGGWDEGYRLHAEDLDLCRRVRIHGGRVAVANSVRVVHLRGVSSRSRPYFVEWHKHHGLWRYFRKFEAARRAWPLRIGVWGAIWAHFCVVAMRLMTRRGHA